MMGKMTVNQPNRVLMGGRFLMADALFKPVRQDLCATFVAACSPCGCVRAGSAREETSFTAIPGAAPQAGCLQAECM